MMITLSLKFKVNYLNCIFREEVNKDEYLDLTHIISSFNLQNLSFFKFIYSGALNGASVNSIKIPENIRYNFITLQLLDLSTSNIGTIGGGGPEYKRTDLGWKLAKIII